MMLRSMVSGGGGILPSPLKHPSQQAYTTHKLSPQPHSTASPAAATTISKRELLSTHGVMRSPMQAQPAAAPVANVHAAGLGAAGGGLAAGSAAGILLSHKSLPPSHQLIAHLSGSSGGGSEGSTTTTSSSSSHSGGSHSSVPGMQHPNNQAVRPTPHVRPRPHAGEDALLASVWQAAGAPGRPSGPVVVSGAGVGTLGDGVVLLKVTSGSGSSTQAAVELGSYPAMTW